MRLRGVTNPQVLWWARQTCPSHLRITPYGSTPRVYYEVPWTDKDAFWLVLDVKNRKHYYLPTIEACLKIELYGDDSAKFRRLLKISSGKDIFKDRFIIERVSKFVFIRNTGRKKKICWHYKKEITDDEEVCSNGHGPVPLAKYER